MTTEQLMTGIHPSAIVDDGARIGANVTIGPFAIIGPDCTIGDNCVIAARATLERHVTLGPNVKVGIGSVLGGDPQDLKFKGEVTTVEIGAGTTIREYSTINRGTSQSFKTTVGENCFIMSYVHLAHDCHIGNGVILGNTVQLAGHVTIEDRAIISGVTAVHQFVKIGKYSFIGGCSRVPEGRRAVREGGGESDQAVRPELGRTGAERISRGGAARAEARVPPVLQVGAQLVAGAGEGGGGAASRIRKFRSFSTSSTPAIAGS